MGIRILNIKYSVLPKNRSKYTRVHDSILGRYIKTCLNLIVVGQRDKKVYYYY
jgi:hypothetical protein